MRDFLGTLFLAAAMASVISCTAQAQDLIFKGKPPKFEDYGYFVRRSSWQFASSNERIIFVCWENPSNNNERERAWVRSQIESTWQKHSQIVFKGWQKCATDNSGIHILISDEGPHVKAFGRHLDAKKNGMVLNFTFVKWSPACQSMRESCIRSIAVHEFGHAIGFAHEQNRPDTPGECYDLHGQGQLKEKMLTPYDPSSVMNYCNPTYNNEGKLSSLDIKSLQLIYGKP